MLSRDPSRGPHPCLDRECGHSAADHLRTPELAGPREVVVFCAGCRRHEVERPRAWWRRGRRPRPETGVPGLTRAN